MRRLPIALGVLAVGLAAGLAVALLTRPSSRTETVTTTRVEMLNGSRLAGREPAPLPTLLEGAAGPRRLALSGAVPVDANLDSADYVVKKPAQLVVTWDRAHLTRDRTAATWQRRGVAVWQLDRGNFATWHRVYTYEVPITNVTGVEGFGIHLGDISGDGRPEVMIVFDTDGSAGGADYHVFANVGQVFRQVLMRRLSMDEGTISFSNGALLMREGIDHRGQGIHCCYRRVRETWLRLDGHRLATVRSVIRKNRRGWPPG